MPRILQSDPQLGLIVLLDQWCLECPLITDLKLDRLQPQVETIYAVEPNVAIDVPSVPSGTSRTLVENPLVTDNGYSLRTFTGLLYFIPFAWLQWLHPESLNYSWV